MIRAPRSLFASASLSLALLAGAPGCKKAETPTAAPTEAPSAGVGEAARSEPEREAVEMIRWRLDVENLADVLAQLEVVVAQLQGGDQPKLSLRPLVEALMTQRGVPPAFAKSLDWSGRWSVSAGYPQPGQEHARPDDLELVANFAATAGDQFFTDLPPGWSVEPGADGVSQLTRQDLRFDVQASPNSVLVGRRAGDLDAAAKLHGEKMPARITVRSENIHVGDIDPSELLPLPAALSKPIGAALRSATSVEALLDASTQVGLRAHLQASADLSRFGFSFLGRPISKLSPLADRLPPGAAVLVHMSWGDPKLIHEELDRMTERVPEPFDAWIADIKSGAHETLDVVREEAILGLYFDEKGQAALVIAGGIVDQKKANDAVRKVMSGTYGLAERYRGLVGDDRDYRFKVDFKPEGLGFSKAKVDILEATVPKAMLQDAKRVEMFVGAEKPELEMLAHMDERFGIVAIGAGARGVMANWVRHLGAQRRVSAETDGGLALARSTSAGARAGEGCQLCVALEPVSALRMWLQHQRDFAGDAEAGKRLEEAQALASTGPAAFALRAGAKEVALGLGVSHRLIYAEPSVLGTLMRLGDWLPDRFEDAPSK